MSATPGDDGLKPSLQRIVGSGKKVLGVGASSLVAISRSSSPGRQEASTGSSIAFLFVLGGGCRSGRGCGVGWLGRWGFEKAVGRGIGCFRKGSAVYTVNVYSSYGGLRSA